MGVELCATEMPSRKKQQTLRCAIWLIRNMRHSRTTNQNFRSGTPDLTIPRSSCPRRQDLALAVTHRFITDDAVVSHSCTWVRHPHLGVVIKVKGEVPKKGAPVVRARFVNRSRDPKQLGIASDMRPRRPHPRYLEKNPRSQSISSRTGLCACQKPMLRTPTSLQAGRFSGRTLK